MDSVTMSVLTGVACCLGVAMLLVKAENRKREWKQKIQRARNKREIGFRRAEEEVCRFKTEHPTTEATHILSLSLSELQEKLQQGSVSREEVFFSYMEKALALQSKLNCCTEILLESFDQVKTAGFNKEGLLSGVPVSIKDNIGHKNYDNTCGLIMNLDKPATKDSVLVEVLKKQGAIPFVKTNVPQALLSMDCCNPIFGDTVNPHNTLKSPGGSSGGEGALIGGGGSLLGIGTDIAGSIRIPASFCGICGLKPTSGRLSTQGVCPILPGQKTLKSTVGPMARDVDGLARLMEALLCDDMFFLDPTVPPLPFNMQIYQSTTPLRIGYLINDGIMQPSPSMARAIRETKALLENAGHVLVPYHPLNVVKAVSEMQRGSLADGGATLVKCMQGGPVDPTFSQQYFVLSLPTWLKKLVAFLLKPVSPRNSHRMKSVCGVGSVQNLWKNHAFIEECTVETVAYWRKCNIDVLLCPAIGPAYQVGHSGKASHSVSYTIMYNGLNFPAGVVPVSTVTAEDEEELRNYKGIYQDILDKSFKKAVRGGVGLPVAVQCVALPWQDELCLRFMREVEKLVKESRN